MYEYIRCTNEKLVDISFPFSRSHGDAEDGFLIIYIRKEKEEKGAFVLMRLLYFQ